MLKFAHMILNNVRQERKYIIYEYNVSKHIDFKNDFSLETFLAASYFMIFHLFSSSTNENIISFMKFNFLLEQRASNFGI